MASYLSQLLVPPDSDVLCRIAGVTKPVPIGEPLRFGGEQARRAGAERAAEGVNRGRDGEEATRGDRQVADRHAVADARGVTGRVVDRRSAGDVEGGERLVDARQGAGVVGLQAQAPAR